MSDLSAAFAFLQVVLIDVSLSGDNAIIIGMAAAGLPLPQRRHGIAIGIGAAIALRIVFAVLTIYLLDVPGLVLVGGVMLAWVCVTARTRLLTMPRRSPRRSGRRLCKSPSPTSRCRSTTCWPSPAPRVTTRM